MSFRALVFLLLAALATVRAQTPREQAEQDLRARAQEFFQMFVDGQYRKALDMVAEDTKDEYFASGKMEIKSFTVDKVKVDDSLQKGTVDLTVKRVWRVRLDQVVVDTPMPTTWKIENGKWVWYHETIKNSYVTPMGPSDTNLVQRKPDGTVDLPNNLDPDAILKAGQKILQQTQVDRNEISLPTDHPSSEKVKFHNGAQGSVGLQVNGMPSIPGFTAKLDRSIVNYGEDATLEIQYAPPAVTNADDKPVLPDMIQIALVVSPFNQEFRVQVKFQK